MSVANLVLEYLRATIWPLAMIFSLMLFRKELQSIVQRLVEGEIDAAGIRMRFSLNELQTARAELRKADDGSPEQSTLGDDVRARIHLEAASILDLQINHISGDHFSRVSQAFIGLISVVTDLCDKFDVELPPHPKGTYAAALRELVRLGALPASVMDASMRLEKIYASQTFRDAEEPAERAFVDLYVATARDLAREIAIDVMTWHELRAQAGIDLDV